MYFLRKKIYLTFYLSIAWLNDSKRRIFKPFLSELTSSQLFHMFTKKYISNPGVLFFSSLLFNISKILNKINERKNELLYYESEVQNLTVIFKEGLLIIVQDINSGLRVVNKTKWNFWILGK